MPASADSMRLTISILLISRLNTIAGFFSETVTYCARFSENELLCTTRSLATKLWSTGTVTS